MKRLSVIIPIFNVEKYIEKCIQSLEFQDIGTDEYEIICINDGSPDDSKNIVLELSKRYTNIILVDQENQGVSRARNNGIDMAMGKYLLFIDPDDYVEPNSFKYILGTAEENKPQVAFLGFTFLNSDGSVRDHILSKPFENKMYTGTDSYFIARRNGSIDPDRMVAVLFERDFINKNYLRYLPDVPYLEDGEFISRILCLAERCIFIGQPFYQRTTRKGSATNSGLYNSHKATAGFLLSAINLRIFQDKNCSNEKQKLFLNHPICKFVLLTLNSALNRPYYQNFKIIRARLSENQFDKLDLKGVVRPYKYYAALYNNFAIFFLVSAIIKGIRASIKNYIKG